MKPINTKPPSIHHALHICCIRKIKVIKYLLFQIRQFPLHHICYRSAAHYIIFIKNYVNEAQSKQNLTQDYDNKFKNQNLLLYKQGSHFLNFRKNGVHGWANIKQQKQRFLFFTEKIHFCIHKEMGVSAENE